MTKKSKILLVRPENIYRYNNYPSLSLISIGSKLKEAGFEVAIINSSLEKDILATVKRHLEENILFTGVSFLTSEIPDAYQIISFIKKNSNVPVVVGGWHPTLFPEQMAKSEIVDYVISGEGEEHILTLAKYLESGYKINSKIFPKIINNIENLPLSEYSLDSKIEFFINSYLTDKLSEYVKQPMRWLPYESSRGCPSQCTFCINMVTDNTRYRKKSAEKVISEIEAIIDKYRLTHLKIIDDNFFVDINRVRQICEGMLKKGLDVSWDAECRCDYFNERMLDDETLRLLKRSGLIQLTLGIESGSLHTLQLLKKGIVPQQAEYAVKQCDRYGIIARSSFILEVPGETIDDIKQTVHFINRLRKYHYFTCGVGTFRPYPKCEIATRLIRNGHLKEPTKFTQWTDPAVIEMYTSAEYSRPWQVASFYSESAAYYLNMESAVRLGNYQISRLFDRIKNNFFINIAKIRNRFMFYQFPFDKELYKHFLKSFYRKRQGLEKAGAYPLARPNDS